MRAEIAAMEVGIGNRQVHCAPEVDRHVAEQARLHRWRDVEGQQRATGRDRTSVVLGKSVSVRVDIGGRRLITKKKTIKTNKHNRPIKDNSTVHKIIENSK